MLDLCAARIRTLQHLSAMQAAGLTLQMFDARRALCALLSYSEFNAA